MAKSNQIELFPKEKSPLYWANLLAKESIIVNQGGTYSGKTYSIMMVLFTIAIIRPGYVITVMSNTVTKLKEDALRISADIVQTHPVLKEFIRSYNQTDRIYYFTTGSLIEFKSFENPEQAKGGKRHILYVNEATRIPYQTFFEAQIRTTVRTFVDYNPTGTFWIHHKVLENAKEFTSVKVIRSWHVHNPYITQQQRDRIESIQDKDLWRVYARGLTGILKGTVYPNWKMVPDEVFNSSDGLLWYADWGYTNDPTATGRIMIPKPGTELAKDFDLIADELTYSPGIAVPTLHEVFKINGYKEGQEVYCDTDPNMISEMRQQVNPVIAALPWVKGPGSVRSKVLFMRKKRVGYTQRSQNIDVERRNYRFNEIEGILTNEPVDDYNHHMDGIAGSFYTYCLRRGLTA